MFLKEVPTLAGDREGSLLFRVHDLEAFEERLGDLGAIVLVEFEGLLKNFLRRVHVLRILDPDLEEEGARLLPPIPVAVLRSSRRRAPRWLDPRPPPGS